VAGTEKFNAAMVLMFATFHFKSRYDAKTGIKLPLFHEKDSIYLRHSYLPIPSILTLLYHAIKIFSAPKN
jgi:hypothetical protein